MTFNSEVQDTLNGPWTKSFRERVSIVRSQSGLTFKQIGDSMGFSGAFVSSLLGGNANMGSQHGEKVLRGLRALEIKANISSGAHTHGSTNASIPDNLSVHIKAIKDAGGTVTF